MNEKELFDALAKDCPNELAKHDAKVRADMVRTTKNIIQNYHAYIDADVIAMIFNDLEKAKEQKE